METQLALVKLMEECAEVTHAASKCIRFGINTTWEGYGNNLKVLIAEIEDLQKAINHIYFIMPALDGHK